MFPPKYVMYFLGIENINLPHFRHGRRIVGGLCAGDGGAEGEVAATAGGDEGGALHHGHRLQEAAQAAAQRDAGTKIIFYPKKYSFSIG